MDNIGTTRAANADADPLNAWLDGCYRRWKKAYRWPLLIVMTLVWLPAAIQIPIQYQYFINKMPDMFLRELASWLKSNGPMLSMLIGVIVATVASSCLKFEPEVVMTATRKDAFSALRSAIRVQSYNRIIWLMLIPSIAVLVICFIAVEIRVSAMRPLNLTALYTLLFHIFFFAVCCWIGGELSQFVNLRYYTKTTLQRIFFVVITAIIYIGLIWFLPRHLESFMKEPIWLYGRLILLCAFVLPVGLSIYMMLATRKPTKAMLERL